MKTAVLRRLALLLGFALLMAAAVPGGASGPDVPDVDSPFIFSVNEDTIQLGWRQGAGIEGVRIYRRSPASADLATVVWTADAGADGRGLWTDTGLDTGEVYEYCIQTYSGGASGRLFTWLTAVPLGKPDVTSVSETAAGPGGERQAAVSWRAVAEADGYEFWLGMEEGPFDVIADTPDTSGAYTLPEGFLTCNFMVRAYVTYRGAKYMGPWGAGMSLYAPEESAGIPAPVRLEAYPFGNDSASLFWDAGGAADSYLVYRSTGPDGPGGYLASASGRMHLDTGLACGTTYFYRVAAVRGAYRSAFSNAAWATPMDTPEITGISFRADIPAGTLEAAMEWTAACPGARYLVGELSPGYDPETGNTADTAWAAVNPLPSAVTVYRYFVQPYVEPSAGILSYGPPSEPAEAVYPEMAPVMEPPGIRFEGVPPWEDPWHSGWLEDLIESYADSGCWPRDPAPGSGRLAELAGKLLKGIKLTDEELGLKGALRADGLALLLAAYDFPPDPVSAAALSGLLNQMDSLTGGYAPETPGSEGKSRYGRLLEHARALLGADGDAAPARTAAATKTPAVNPTWTPTPWAVLVTPVIIPVIQTPKPPAIPVKP